MDFNEANKRWFDLQPITGVLFYYNDTVKIRSGEHKNEIASVISLISLEPVTYLIELASGGGDIQIAQWESEKDE